MTRPSILVVEDDEDILELIAYNLEKECYAVHRAMSGEDALKAVDKSVPGLLLLDQTVVCRALQFDDTMMIQSGHFH